MQKSGFGAAGAHNGGVSLDEALRRSVWAVMLTWAVSTSSAWASTREPASGTRLEPVTWTLLGIPPNSIPINGEPSDGQFDLILKLVISQMPGREHKYVYANTGRIVTMLQEGFPACYVSSTTTPERKAIAHLTVNGVVPPLRLLARKAVVPKLPRNAQQEVLLEQLFARTDITGAVERGRSYSVGIDAALAKAASGLSFSRTQSMQMLRSGRVDYTIGFDTQLSYELRTGERLPLDGELISLPIAGEQVRYTAFACPRTPWGQAMVDELDGILRRLARSPEYLAAMNKWLSAEERERMRPVMREFLRLRATTPNFDDAPAPAGATPRRPGPN